MASKPKMFIVHNDSIPFLYIVCLFSRNAVSRQLQAPRHYGPQKPLSFCLSLKTPRNFVLLFTKKIFASLSPSRKNDEYSGT